MAFESLSEKLSAVFKRLRSKGKLSEPDVKEAMREVRLALLEADVNYKVAKDFTKRVSERAVGSEVMESLTPAQMVVKIVNEELIELMGKTQERLNMPSKPPAVVMLCGLQGSGKTTHAGKLAYMLKKSGHRPLLTACDIYRPAAITQLKVLGDKISVPIFERGEEDPVETAELSVRHAKDYGYDIVIIDTAGRLHIDEVLMDELKRMEEAINPTDILLVVDAMTGQDAVNVAKSFDDTLGITGVILTKLDGDTRGGAALSVREVTGKPIKFCGIGEKVEDLEQFYPDRMASRILGMGDVLSLIEDVEKSIDLKQAEKMSNKLSNNDFDFNDFLEMTAQMKRMGPMKSIISKIPGLDNKIKDVDIDDRQIDRVCAIILSMTPRERSKPSIINASRKKRIASGSGMKVEDVNKLLKQFDQMQKVIKTMGVFKKKKKKPFMGFRNFKI